MRTEHKCGRWGVNSVRTSAVAVVCAVIVLCSPNAAEAGEMRMIGALAIGLDRTGLSACPED